MVHAVRPHQRLRTTLYNLFAFAILTLGALPAVWIIFTAIRPNSEINVTPPIWIPQQITFDTFGSRFGLNPDYAVGVPVPEYLRNSILVSVMSTVVSIALGTMAGYAFSRFEFRGSRLVFLLIMLSRAGHRAQSAVVPAHAQLRLDRHCAWAGVRLCGGQYALHRLADGWLLPPDPERPGRIGIYRRLRLLDGVLALPGMAAASIFAFLAAWNEYQIASLVTQTPQSKTFPVGLFDLTSQFTVDWRAMCAMSVLMMIPAIIFVVSTQRSMVRGLTFGAIKG
jgi:multiple sugar transport system permease protein